MRKARVILCGFCFYSAAAIGAEPLGADAVGQPASERLSAREAGVRYGQALGAVLVCYGLKATPGVEALRSAYGGGEAGLFKAEADKIVEAWQDAKGCRRSGGPNECRLSIEWSCQEALREIGPAGSRLPGLVEPVR